MKIPNNCFVLLGIILFLICCKDNVNKLEFSNTDSKIDLDSLKIVACDGILKEILARDLIKTNPIIKTPTTFEESLLSLDTMLNIAFKKWISCLPDGDFSMYVHNHLGKKLRNDWKLWGDSKLVRDFNNMEIFHPDDMSAIILDSYQRKIKKEALKLKEQVNYYKEYWRNSQ